VTQLLFDVLLFLLLPPPPPLNRPESYIKMDNFYTVTVYEKVRHGGGGGGLLWGEGACLCLKVLE
jgi:hypothetical protein